MLFYVICDVMLYFYTKSKIRKWIKIKIKNKKEQEQEQILLSSTLTNMLLPCYMILFALELSITFFISYNYVIYEYNLCDYHVQHYITLHCLNLK